MQIWLLALISSLTASQYCYGYGRMVGKVGKHRNSDWATVSGFDHSTGVHAKLKEIKFFFDETQSLQMIY